MAKFRIRNGESTEDPLAEQPTEPSSPDGQPDLMDLPMGGGAPPPPAPAVPEPLEPTKLIEEGEPTVPPREPKPLDPTTLLEEPAPPAAEPELRRAALPDDSAGSNASAQRLQRTEKAAAAPTKASPTTGGGPAKPAAKRAWLWPALTALVLGAVAGFFANRHPAVAVLDQDLASFGEVRLAETSSAIEVELRNTGQQKLLVGGFQISGDGADQFSVVDGSCTGMEIREEESCRLKVVFVPRSTGPQQAKLEILSEAANPARIPLMGIGIAPLMEVEPAELNFEKATVGSRTRRQTLRFANRGSAPLKIAAVSLDGDGAADFVITGDDCSGTTLAPSERCQISTAFLPTAAGERRAALRLLGGDDSEALATPPELVGEGLPQEPSLRLEPQRVNFADLRVGTEVQEKIVLTNDGTGPLTIRSLSITQEEGEESADEPLPLTLNKGQCGRRPLSPGGSCTVEVGYLPAAEGGTRAFLEIRHDAGRGLHRVALVGNGIAPHIFLDPARLAFDEVALGAESPARFLRLVNSGTGPLTVQQIRATGKDAAAFIARPVGCTTGPIAAKASCGVEVRFRPTHPGAHTAELALSHDAEGETDRVPLSGRGAAGRLSVDKDRLSFGEVHVTESASRELVVRNSGRARMTVERVSITGRSASDFTLDDRCSGTRLPPGESCQVLVRFAPTSAGERRATIRLADDVSDRPLEVPLTARATPPPVPGFRARPVEVSFGDVLLGERPDALQVTVTNPGTGPLAIRDLQITGDHSLDYRIAPGTCENGPVAPGGSCTVGIRFVPNAVGVRAAVLEIQHNADGSPARLRLTGTGTVPPPPPPPPGRE